jgi:hypothetical protein
MNNQQRATTARKALVAFEGIASTGGVSIEETAGDLICNIFHLLDAEGIPHEQVLDTAMGHYQNETGETNQ